MKTILKNNMASEVFSGSGNFSYTNNTGQNVRVVINYMAASLNTRARDIFGVTNPGGAGPGIEFTWAGVSINSTLLVIGRNLATSYIENSAGGAVSAREDNMYRIIPVAAYSGYGVAHNNNAIAVPIRNVNSGGITGSGALPTEIMLRPGQTFRANCGVYNVVVIPENG